MLPKKNNPIADGSKFAVQVHSSTSKHLGPANQKKFEKLQWLNCSQTIQIRETIRIHNMSVFIFVTANGSNSTS